MIEHLWIHPGGWPRYRMLTRRQRAVQRLREAWWILIGRHSLHRAWQVGHDQGCMHEYHRLVTNKAYIAEIQARGWISASPESSDEEGRWPDTASPSDGNQPDTNPSARATA